MSLPNWAERELARIQELDKVILRELGPCCGEPNKPTVELVVDAGKYVAQLEAEIESLLETWLRYSENLDGGRPEMAYEAFEAMKALVEQQMREDE